MSLLTTDLATDFSTQPDLPKVFHRLMQLVKITPSISCEAIFYSNGLAARRSLICEICASEHERGP